MLQYKEVVVEYITRKTYCIPIELLDNMDLSVQEYAYDHDSIERWLFDEDQDITVTETITMEQEDDDSFTDAYSDNLPLWEDKDEDEMLPNFYKIMRGDNNGNV